MRFNYLGLWRFSARFCRSAPRLRSGLCALAFAIFPYGSLGIWGGLAPTLALTALARWRNTRKTKNFVACSLLYVFVPAVAYFAAKTSANIAPSDAGAALGFVANAVAAPFGIMGFYSAFPLGVALIAAPLFVRQFLRPEEAGLWAFTISVASASAIAFRRASLWKRGDVVPTRYAIPMIPAWFVAAIVVVRAASSVWTVRVVATLLALNVVVAGAKGHAHEVGSFERRHPAGKCLKRAALNTEAELTADERECLTLIYPNLNYLEIARRWRPSE